MNTILVIVIKAVLGWLTSLLERLIQRQKDIQKGRDEIIDLLKNKEKAIDQALEELRNTPATGDDDIDFLRDRSNRRKNPVPRN